MKIVVNRCHGGFGLSYEATMEYARLAGIKLYASVNARKPNGSLDLDHQKPFDVGSKEPYTSIHYTTKPLTANGQIEEDSYWSDHDLKRDDLILIEVVRKLGEKANDDFAQLEIVNVPSDVKWQIDDYDGYESVHEVHRSW